MRAGPAWASLSCSHLLSDPVVPKAPPDADLLIDASVL
ncbi:MAG: hypothetical protein AVDCRST_MAG12-237 [uncultured Rubrobacteraceae bacterium]|uniref:Uncharacterized protein n=1 Tax=uncultured Rubrobacteraceae bacterium TaxID=349277 RepID=A0A6J4RCG6_9ACTN|nr:MAG: hypothetical protein AVDCRST_MAG12-237 [uncultured Rubrobacteraceae bacterium]